MRSYARLLHKFFVEDGPYCLKHLKPKKGNIFTHREWPLCEGLVDDFGDAIRSNRNKPQFRRGDIERLVEKHIKKEDSSFRLKSYQHLISRVPHGNPTTSIWTAAYYILNVNSTIYEAYHARELQTVGGMFSLHETRLIENGLYDQLAKLPLREEAESGMPVQEGSLNVDALSAEQIANFRKRDEFHIYCELLKKIKPVPPGKRFVDVNSSYVNYLFDSYVPSIVKQYPDATGVRRGLYKTGAGLKAVGVIGEHCGDLLMVGGKTVATVLSHTGDKVIEAAEPVSDLAMWARRKWARRRFRMNNYAEWNEVIEQRESANDKLPADDSSSVKRSDVRRV